MEWIISHGDTDGICSAGIALSAFKDAKLFFSHPIGLPEDLKSVDGDVIICDIALARDVYKETLKELRRLKDNGKEVIYIDHHPLPEEYDPSNFPAEMVHSVNSCASEQTYKKLEEKVSPDMSRLAIIGAIGDYLDKTYEIDKLLIRWEKRNLYFEAGILIQAIESTGRNYQDKREIAYFISNNKTPSSDENLVRKAISASIVEEDMRKRIKEEFVLRGNVAYVIDLGWSLGKSAVYSKGLAGALVGIGAEHRKDYVEMSLRTHSDSIDLNLMLKRITAKMGGMGGGHPKASGARIPREKFSQFIAELNEAIIEKKKEHNEEY